MSGIRAQSRSTGRHGALAQRCLGCSGVGFDLFQCDGVQGTAIERCDYCAEVDTDTANEVAWLLVQERLVGGVALEFSQQSASAAALRHLRRLHKRFGARGATPGERIVLVARVREMEEQAEALALALRKVLRQQLGDDLDLLLAREALRAFDQSKREEIRMVRAAIPPRA